MKEWIDNIFGVNQIPPENKRRNSCNVFHRFSYEQNAEKLIEQKNNKQNDEETKNNLKLMINFIMNFGQTPYQLFHEPHCKVKIIIKKEEADKIGEKDKEKENIWNFAEDKDNEEECDYESYINDTFRNQNSDLELTDNPLYFQINPLINKFFVFNEKGNIIVVDCELFNKYESEFYELIEHFYIEKSNILLCDKIKKYFRNNIKYSFFSFDNYISKNNFINMPESFHTYSTNILNDIKEKKNSIKQTTLNQKNKLFLFMTCRHIDYSFKIYLCLEDNKDKKNSKEKIFNIFSFICEDFVCSCCCVSTSHFIVGLKNGKLIYYSLNMLIEENNSNNKKTKNKKGNNILDNVKIKVKMEKYIQGHKGKINVIEIDKKIGVVITSGDDNYIFIRKLYDFELLLPIKIKSKYLVLMCKISSFNFLYVLCYNKKKDKSVIFGYTLGGLKFAKSEYGSYDNICFTENGNIVTMNDREGIITLSGSDLSRINIDDDDDDEEIEKIKQVKNSNWTQFDCFKRKFENDISKIITFFSVETKDYYKLKYLDVSKIKYFD